MIDSNDQTPNDDLAMFDQIASRCASLRLQIQRVIIGQDTTVDLLLTALFCQGHVLIVGVPGLAKTLLVRTLGRAMHLDFHRIQFTPDMMPSDILGTELIQEDPSTGKRELKFLPGPIFAQLILADEINRTPPKTQAALLEAMAEQQVSITGETRPLRQPFLVVATQNPIEQEGTYPLPEAQLDRFMFSLWMDYPSREEEINIVAETPRIRNESVEIVFDEQALLKCIELIWRMPVSRHVVEYAVQLARATRPADEAAPQFVKKYVSWGAGPRAGQYLIHAAKALAAIQGDPAPSCEHVRRVSMAVLRHRILVNYAASGDGVSAADLINKIVEQVAEPAYVA